MKFDLRHEIIGLHVKVVASDNKSLVGLEGKVIDETQNTLVLEQGKTLLKDQIVLEMSVQDHTVIVDGKTLLGRSHERIKK